MVEWTRASMTVQIEHFRLKNLTAQLISRESNRNKNNSQPMWPISPCNVSSYISYSTAKPKSWADFFSFFSFSSNFFFLSFSTFYVFLFYQRKRERVTLRIMQERSKVNFSSIIAFHLILMCFRFKFLSQILEERSVGSFVNLLSLTQKLSFRIFFFLILTFFFFILWTLVCFYFLFFRSGVCVWASKVRGDSWQKNFFLFYSDLLIGLLSFNTLRTRVFFCFKYGLIFNRFILIYDFDILII